MKLEGIVLSEIDYKESSKIVNLYTPNGRIGIKALGSKKIKNGLLGFTTTGNTVSFVATDSKLPSLIEYDIIDSIIVKNLDLDSIKILGVIIYIINNLPNDIDNKIIYNFIKNVISSIGKINSNKLISIFLIKMLYAFGVSPNLKSCVNCNNKDNLISFNIQLGGALCNNCSNEINDLKIWNEYYYDKKNLEDFSDTDYIILINEIKRYYEYHLNIKLKL